MIREIKLGYIAAITGIFITVGIAPVSSQENTENKNIAAFEIQSILSKKCFDCHGADMQTSGLRLDDRPRALAGGNSGKAAIVPGDAITSAMVYRITLPADHKSAMPPKGSERLTSEEILRIAHWIYSGADWPAYTDEQELAGTISPAKAKPIDDGSRNTSVQAADVEPAEQIEPASDEAIAALQETGAIVVPLAQGTNRIQVNFVPVADQIGDKHLSLLAPLSEQLTWLSLSRSAITDDGLEKLTSLDHLKKLHLDNTQISGSALVHLKSLGDLEYLNLYGTHVDDVGLEALKDLKNLKAIYLWQTKVTEEGVDRLHEALPELAISFGWNYELKQKLMDILKEPVNKSLQLSQAVAKEAIIHLLVKNDLEAVDSLEKVINEKRLILEQEAKALEDPYARLVLLFDKGSCCATAHEEGKKCDHPCCIDARGQNRVCLKCNPGAADKQNDE